MIMKSKEVNWNQDNATSWSAGMAFGIHLSVMETGEGYIWRIRSDSRQFGRGIASNLQEAQDEAFKAFCLLVLVMYELSKITKEDK